MTIGRPNVGAVFRITVAAAVTIFALLAVSCRRSLPAPSNTTPVILISIDTLRSDHLPAYGYAKVATPNIDALRADARFQALLRRSERRNIDIAREICAILDERRPRAAGKYEELLSGGDDNHDAITANWCMIDPAGCAGVKGGVTYGASDEAEGVAVASRDPAQDASGAVRARVGGIRRGRVASRAARTLSGCVRAGLLVSNHALRAGPRFAHATIWTHPLLPHFL